jgi:hypothetical protein
MRMGDGKEEVMLGWDTNPRDRDFGTAMEVKHPQVTQKTVCLGS